MSHELARQVRGSICQPLTDAQHRTVERNGKTYTQNTANIGKKQEVESDSTRRKKSWSIVAASSADSGTFNMG